METIQQILTRYWGHTHFRPLQEDIINSVLEGKDTFVRDADIKGVIRTKDGDKIEGV